MITSIALSLAPVLIIALYLYSRDKYEKEPASMLFKALGMGVLIVLPAILMELWFESLATSFFPLQEGPGQFEFKFIGNATEKFYYSIYQAFFVASFTEETLKYLAFMLIIWRNKNFNEFFDGIIYASYISLGFAAIENIFYVMQMGSATGVLRAFTAVPGHALFGVTMGYYLGLAKFKSNKVYYLIMAIVMPIILHGIYDLILISGKNLLMLLFIPFVLLLWILGFQKMKQHSDNSIFNPKNKKSI